MEGGEEDRRKKIGVTSVPHWGAWRRGLCPKKCCTEPDYLKWKFLKRRYGALQSWQSERQKKEIFGGVGGGGTKWKKWKCDTKSINNFLSHYREAKWYLYEGLRTHLQVEMVSCLTEMLLHPNPCNYISYSTCVSTHVQHYSHKVFFFSKWEQSPALAIQAHRTKKKTPPQIIVLIIETIYLPNK